MQKIPTRPRLMKALIVYDSEMFFIKKIHDEKHMSYYLLNALDTW